ncbi:MAG: hypothetical protein V4819_06060 [Verrucomicrobiota bacterium]
MAIRPPTPTFPSRTQPQVPVLSLRAWPSTLPRERPPALHQLNSETSAFQANTTYTTGAYTNGYESFAAGQNYVALSISIAAGQSLFVASDGTETELRGFLNMAQIVAIPEPAAALLGALGMMTLLRRRRD